LITTKGKCRWTKKGEMNFKTNQIKVNCSLFACPESRCNATFLLLISRGTEVKEYLLGGGRGWGKKITQENFTAPDQTEVWR